MWLLLSLLAFALAVASHAVLCRLPLRMDFVVKSLFAGAPIGVGLVSVLVIREGLIIETFAAALLYALLLHVGEHKCLRFPPSQAERARTNGRRD